MKTFIIISFISAILLVTSARPNEGSSESSDRVKPNSTSASSPSPASASDDITGTFGGLTSFLSTNQVGVKEAIKKINDLIDYLREMNKKPAFEMPKLDTNGTAARIIEALKPEVAMDVLPIAPMVI